MVDHGEGRGWGCFTLANHRGNPVFFYRVGRHEDHTSTPTLRETPPDEHEKLLVSLGCKFRVVTIAGFQPFGVIPMDFLIPFGIFVCFLIKNRG